MDLIASVVVGEGFPPGEKELPGILTLTICLLAFRLTPLPENKRGRAAGGKLIRHVCRLFPAPELKHGREAAVQKAKYVAKLIPSVGENEESVSHLETSCSERLARRIGHDCQHPHSVDAMPFLGHLTLRLRRRGPNNR